MDWNIGRIAFDCLSQATQYQNRIGESEVLHVLQIRNTEQQQQPVAAAAENPDALECVATHKWRLRHILTHLLAVRTHTLIRVQLNRHRATIYHALLRLSSTHSPQPSTSRLAGALSKSINFLFRRKEHAHAHTHTLPTTP